ncbi:MAG: type II toxin-antitoxin system Phd/YefM family antitoxin [Chloroflexi bacterium]|nr:type II toxin-antitoxin system Phd/YefM family antitoxin [Chloroflexota bacterium]
MRTATITEVRNRLGALIDEVRTGETIVITDRGVPVAQITSAVGAADDTGDARSSRLERAGILRLPAKPPLSAEYVRAILRGDPPAGGVEALLAEREEGR